MIMKLKMCTIGKIFGKICLKAIRDTFFQYLVSYQKRNEVRYEGKGRGMSMGHSIFWWAGSDPSPVLPLVANLDPPRLVFSRVF